MKKYPAHDRGYIGDFIVEATDRSRGSGQDYEVGSIGGAGSRLLRRGRDGGTCPTGGPLSSCSGSFCSVWMTLGLLEVDETL